MPNLSLTGKTALVTGAGRGFGTGIARGFAQAGANVCIVDINGEELSQAYEEVVAEAEQYGNQVYTQVADVAEYAQMKAVVDHIIAHWGSLDIVVPNAAILPDVTFEETPPDLWHRIIGINLTGVYNCVYAAWPHLVKQGGGHCISIASGASVRGFYNEVAYSAAKHGLEGFTKALAMEGELKNVAVNTMGPGKRIKPTSLSRDAAMQIPDSEQAIWVEPITLAPAFIWLSLQPPARFTGLRFDAGPIADAISAEGYDFQISPNKLSLYPDDLLARLQTREQWTQLEGYRSPMQSQIPG